VALFFFKSDGLLDLLNEKFENADDVETAELPLKREHAVLVQRVIKRILQLTKPLRERPDTPAEIRDMLFIYESSGVRAHGKVMHFEGYKALAWCEHVRDRHGLKTTDGGPLAFTLVRFRPTRLTEMAAQGKDFFEIQHAAGHKSVKQTLAYIERHTLDVAAQREVTKALEQISANRAEFDAPEPSTRKVIPIVPFKGLISNCKNVFDPPRHAMMAADYVEGQACTRYNMCLLCKNVVIMTEHLPVLAHYRAQLAAALSNSATDLPHIVLYEKSRAILDQLFDPQTGEFDEEDLEAAIEASELLDIVVDPLVYTGVIE
jgi:hypothetical protein